MSAALVLTGIEQRFGKTRVLDDVSLSIEAGERHALIGPNGAGKSTLFQVIGGVLRPHAGRVELNGRDVTGHAPHELGRLGLARSFQTTNLFPRLSVIENLRCAVLCGGNGPARWRRWWRHSSEVQKRSRDVLEALGLEHVEDALAGALSYGEQRALDLGIALASGAHTLLVDEPTAGMNREEAARAIGLLRKVSEGKTLVMIEHDMEAVFGLADRVSVLVQGRIIATGTPQAIRQHAAVRAAYLGEARA
ncbi:ABC transporter ATP-binding protein [Trinickia fusca]|uniref:ABC transporter ATP-binding protein n=1 Tax=Trinickia fusca TaxID=2419777 RepID=A0A494XVV2_9BURK|nr:ABC transporter ATP-binding protein [Trinickia fusca]RKP52199.1 ABC transporter ATP-binding protein [Trinickia fusca]